MERSNLANINKVLNICFDPLFLLLVRPFVVRPDCKAKHFDPLSRMRRKNIVHETVPHAEAKAARSKCPDSVRARDGMLKCRGAWRLRGSGVHRLENVGCGVETLSQVGVGGSTLKSGGGSSAQRQTVQTREHSGSAPKA